ncbi:MAG: FAD-dependent oxidoreductase [Microcella pacifica]|jgi:NADPH-dependent 2,4-dienoyl-CoA reductase/sulfur reductase-like enzyme/rhodanese-related sulfurtransferase|uniref:FAD-dependent oxidoreductase n=1 Tax=Microcella pacifica TaxID=2591847 RepID=A0A9E5ML03_9MICO|nr:FAD-dependent oxidoreductase [Microcella pacifica]MBR21128.1 CoA-disulfide reductase [Leifsonia sp.]NHF63934.1 FAD-dependent oxidoreductase [Microcella pacifica]
MTSPRSYVIIGGVAGGMSAATRLRRLDESARITVVERGEHVSFANCGLPYHVGGVIDDRDALILQTPESLAARFALDVRVRTEALSVDRDARTVAVRDLRTGEETSLTYDALILSPGASPVRIPIPGVERGLVLRDLADMDAIIAAARDARRAVVAGGGFIGLELAENLVHAGLDVTVVEMLPQLMRPLDPEMAQLVTDHLRAHGVTVLLGAALRAITESGVELDNTAELGDGAEQLPADLVVLSVGVRPESTLAAEAGLDLDPRGYIVVDEHQRTSDARIYAVGDAVVKQRADGPASPVWLAGLANRHGRLAADAIAGRPHAAVPALGTAVIGLFGLTAATVGRTERELREEGCELRVIHTHPSDHAGYYPGASALALKLVVDARTDAILGAQAIGGGADKRIDIIATAMAGGIPARGLADLELAYAPQYASAKDPVNMLGYIDDNLLDGEDSVQWHELDARLAEGWRLVDVRTEQEHADGAIPGAELMPLDALREHAASLRDEHVIVHCKVGQRGHTAASLLRQYGVTVANLDGGYTTWRSGTASRSLAPQPA